MSSMNNNTHRCKCIVYLSTYRLLKYRLQKYMLLKYRLLKYRSPASFFHRYHTGVFAFWYRNFTDINWREHLDFGGQCGYSYIYIFFCRYMFLAPLKEDKSQINTGKKI